MVSYEDILLRIRGQDNTGSAFNSASQRAGALKTAVGGAVTAMSASMLGYAKSAVDSAMTAEQEWNKFGNAVKNTGGNWDQQSDEIRKWVKEYSNSMGRSVADTRSAMTTYMNMGMSLKESQDAMNATLEGLDKALDMISEQRSSIGATENRLTYTLKNLATTSENLAASQSRIKDVDMAEEIMNYTKQSMINKVAISMLSQANSQAQNVLSLLGGL